VAAPRTDPTTGATTVPVPLSRNRNYRLLWVSRALTGTGGNATVFALPLLVLALTGSPAQTGLAAGAYSAAQLVAGLPAGALADRWDRRRTMLGCEVAAAAALGVLVITVASDLATVWHVLVVAVVLGACRALFDPAEEASLPQVVPESQLATAVALNGARSNVGQLAGTSLGGVLFGLARALPFGADLASRVVSFWLLVFLRLPARERRPAPAHRLGREVVEGLAWVRGQRFIRVIALCAVALNLLFQALYLVVIVVAQQRGHPPGEIGFIAAMLGVGGLAGALLAPWITRKLGPYLSIVAVFWVLAALTPVLGLVDNGYLMGAVFAGMTLLGPAANTTIITHQLLLTPDELRGRVSGLVNLVAGVAGALGPVLGGLLLEVVPGDRALLLCAAVVGLTGLVATVHPALRAVPRTPTTSPLEKLT
jgi:MFS family permease